LLVLALVLGRTIVVQSIFNAIALATRRICPNADCVLAVTSILAGFGNAVLVGLVAVALTRVRIGVQLEGVLVVVRLHVVACQAWKSDAANGRSGRVSL